MNRLVCFSCALIAVASLLAGCASTPDIKRVSPSTTTDVSGNWNDTDSRLVANQLTQQMLGEPWLQNYVRSHGGQRPVVIVGRIVNRSNEHISVSAFINDIQRAIINSGKVRFVASAAQRGAVRNERKDQSLHASAATRNALGQETGADFMMQGTINTIIDAAGDKAVKYYQVNLQLINMANNLIVWVGQKKIKKIVEYDGIRP